MRVEIKSPIDGKKVELVQLQNEWTPWKFDRGTFPEKTGKNNDTENIKEKLSNMEAISRKANIWILGVPETERS